MTDRIMAAVALVLFVGFLGFIATYIDEPDLWLITGAVALMAAYDFVRSLRNNSRPRG